MLLRKILNKYGKERRPIFFMIDFECENFIIEPLENLNRENIFFSIDGVKNFDKRDIKISNLNLKKYLISFDEYKKKFNRVISEIERGNTYLLNLTSKTKIELNESLLNIFYASNAKFKLYFKDKILCFSPERFVSIESNQIFTYPMKGTIDANIKDAKDKILKNPKEMAEHIMVVDLLRNDLGIIGQNVEVEKFRYVDKIKAGKKELYQVSSKIKANLNQNWQNELGDILLNLLPAGSITGTPKRKTVEIIKEIEGFDREFFTGVFGYFDGENLDSSVMIRFIEKDENSNLYYKSGGGITIDSNAIDEYNELIDKIYIPI